MSQCLLKMQVGYFVFKKDERFVFKREWELLPLREMSEFEYEEST